MATPRAAAGVLFLDEYGRTLLVKPTYKPAWDIPGGYVEPDETPLEACGREVREELSLDRQPGPLLVVDWAPAPNEGDKVLFVFDGGKLSADDLGKVRLPVDELAEFRFFAADGLEAVLPDRLSRRVIAALDARRRGVTTYLEHGVPTAGH